MSVRALLAGLLIGPVAAARAAEPTPEDLAVPQIAGPTTGAQAVAVEPVGGPDRSTAVAQLPPDAVPRDGDEPEPARPASRPDGTASAEVLRAWYAIRARGQEPTPELVAREIGPEAISEIFGTPEAPPAEPTPDPAKPPEAGVIVNNLGAPNE